MFVKPDMKVLELACGTGQFTQPLSVYAKEWVATDFSDKMVKECSEKIKGNNITYRVLDATNIECCDNSFDVVLIGNALHVMPEPEKALSEIYRVLNNDGKLFAPTFIVEDKNESLRVKVLEKIGFRIYSKWNSESFIEFISKHGFEVIHKSEIGTKQLTLLNIVAKKN